MRQALLPGVLLLICALIGPAGAQQIPAAPPPAPPPGGPIMVSGGMILLFAALTALCTTFFMSIVLLVGRLLERTRPPAGAYYPDPGARMWYAQGREVQPPVREAAVAPNQPPIAAPTQPPISPERAEQTRWSTSQPQ